MKKVKINCDDIKNSETFHSVFQRVFGFPGFYGENMNAWIDCMSYLNDPEAGMSDIHCVKGDFVLLELDNMSTFKERCPGLYEDLVECSAFVNYRRVEKREHPILMLSFYA